MVRRKTSEELMSETIIYIIIIIERNIREIRWTLETLKRMTQRKALT